MINFNPNLAVYNNLGYSGISNSTRSYNLLKNYDTSYGYGSYMFAAALTKSMQLMALQSAGMTGYGMNRGLFRLYI